MVNPAAGGEHGIRVVSQSLAHQPFHSGRLYVVVGVNKQEILAAGTVYQCVAGFPDAAVRLVGNDSQKTAPFVFALQGFDNSHRPVLALVVNHDNLQVPVGLFQNRPDALLHVGLDVIHRNAHRDKRRTVSFSCFHHNCCKVTNFMRTNQKKRA